MVFWLCFALLFTLNVYQYARDTQTSGNHRLAAGGSDGGGQAGRIRGVQCDPIGCPQVVSRDVCPDLVSTLSSDVCLFRFFFYSKDEYNTYLRLRSGKVLACLQRSHLAMAMAMVMVMVMVMAALLGLA